MQDLARHLTLLTSVLFLAVAALQVKEGSWGSAALWGVACACFAAATIQMWQRSAGRRPLSAEARRQVLELLVEGRRIEAIKRLRSATGANLSEATQAVDAMDKASDQT